ncbi:hypothetical protein J120_02900 [candidate division TM6 bacterium JCVI TM6SC1]|uniref:Polyribonucleotide nucleotidyltransferase n=1 Tax=candidate division TM6 bacterium JCVI TM6SC1 TaxID=1306947 RepID=A0A0D2K4X1_9BACT|nr:hypothetical protein J120_02900 [candidate division TM6 bacterium JCVI TM6SC1]
MVQTFRLPGFEYEVEIGKFARQADGAVWIRQGGTVVLATAVCSPSKDFPGFLPLTIEYRELFSAAGKIPGGYFKREGKATDKEVLTGRLIDRAIRPLFPSNYFDQIQVVTNVYSYDKEHLPATLGLIATSLALAISKIPFMGPVGVIEVARVDNQWVYSPRFSQTQRSDVRMIVAGTNEGITMVEGSSAGISEKDIIDILFGAHEKIKEQIAWQNSVVEQVGVAKLAITHSYDWNTWQAKIDQFLTAPRVQSSYIPDKIQRNEYLSALREEFIKDNEQEITDQKLPLAVVDYMIDMILKDKITDLILELSKRVDGRSYDQIRPISVEVGLLPFTHGSALFTRGRTQALVSATLGGGQDEQRLEGIIEDDSKDGAFMLHYNFPPFSVGEVRAMRGPGRREVGHGHLAASALRAVLPSRENFPYTIRIVADMLESDGSTSMATVCGSTMALMQAGVPISAMVSGIAMGLLKNKAGSFAVLSDISGFEDAFGLMDFKVAGTQDSVTAVQMDIKYKGGLTREVFEVALAQAKKGRAHILERMRTVMTAPNPTLSDLVPKLITLKVATDKIGAIIGGGGKTIREIIEKTRTTIDIEDDGLVKIFGGPDADLELAISWVKTLAGQIEPNALFVGKVKRIADFGLFVELVPGTDGLVHISSIPREEQRTFLQNAKVGDIVNVQVVDYDEATGRIRLKIV